MELVVENATLKNIKGKQNVFVTPDNVKRIAEGAVNSDFLVDTFVIGDTVSEVEFGAFYFSDVRKVVFPEAYLPTKIINGIPWNTPVFNSCRNLEEVVLPKTIGEMASFFLWCYPQKIYVYESTYSQLTDNLLKEIFKSQYKATSYVGKRATNGKEYYPNVHIFSQETNKELIHLYYKYELPGVEPTIERLY